MDVVAGAEFERFLVRHRLRHTGGVDAGIARAAREELGADAILITTLEVYRAAAPPILGLTMRLVSVGGEPIILWMDAAARSGDQSPGLLGLGLEKRFEAVRDHVLADLVGNLRGYLDGEDAEQRCSAGRRHRPKIRFRMEPPSPDGDAGVTVAVVPFLNVSSRRGAGDAVSLEFVRQLVSTGRYRVLEPGVVRDYLLRARVIMPGGVSLETTRLLVGNLGAQVVLSGTVLDFDENPGVQGPTIRFSATMLEAGSGEVLWRSRSANRGDDGVFFFGMGRIRTAPDLACRMVAGVVDEIGRPGSTSVAWRRSDAPTRLTREHRKSAPVRPPANAGTGGAERSAPDAPIGPGET
jgi:hypothetical protein